MSFLQAFSVGTALGSALYGNDSQDNAEQAINEQQLREQEAARAAQQREQDARRQINQLFGVADPNAPRLPDYTQTLTLNTGERIDGSPAWAARLPGPPQPGETHFAPLSPEQQGAIQQGLAAHPDLLTQRPDLARRERYTDLRNTLVDSRNSELDFSRDNALRELNFGLARSGLSGGSVDADRRADAQRTYQRGLTDNSLAGDSLAQQLASSDEALRQQLIGRAQAGGSAADLRAAGSAGITQNQILADNTAAQNGLRTR
jgi:hypothetical protein